MLCAKLSSRLEGSLGTFRLLSSNFTDNASFILIKCYLNMLDLQLMFLSSSSPPLHHPLLLWNMGHIFQSEVKSCESHRWWVGEKGGRCGQWESWGLAPCWTHISPRRHQPFAISSEYLLWSPGSCYGLNVSITPKFLCWNSSIVMWCVQRWNVMYLEMGSLGGN